ncbi:MAG TPA: hypothetical protein VJ483_09120 [Holophagaceae bacterium]|nr:hypothetical protein [Holophagaceae bacterium]
MANIRPTQLALHVMQGLALLAIGLGCDSKPKNQDVTAPPSAAPTDSGSASATAPAEGGKGEAPRSDVRGIGTYVTAGSEGNQAEVDQIQEVQYQWTIVGGTVTDGGDTPTVTYAVDPNAKTLHLYCKLRGPQGAESTAIAHLLVAPMPVIGTFTANPAVISIGGNTKLSWQADGYKTLTMDPDAKDVAQWTGIPMQPKETTTYHLTATNAAGAVATKDVLVKVVPLPSIIRFGFQGPLLVGQSSRLNAEFANGKAEIWEGDRMLASSDQSPIAVDVTPRSESTYQLRVVNEAGATVTQDRIVHSAGY